MKASSHLSPAKLVKLAQAKAHEADSWAEFSNYIFDPETGLIAKAFPKLEDRRRFASTPEYKAIWKLMESVQTRTGLIEGATLKKSGRFVVRLPRSMHAALEVEASREGVSLNQLVVAMLASKLGGIFTNSAT